MKYVRVLFAIFIYTIPVLNLPNYESFTSTCRGNFKAHTSSDFPDELFVTINSTYYKHR